MALTPGDYDFAIHSQKACNLSGLVNTLARILPDIWEEVREAGGGTQDVNEHPIVRLYVEQMSFLASGRGYAEAYEICTNKSKGESHEDGTDTGR